MRVSDPYSFDSDPDPDPIWIQVGSGSGANLDPGFYDQKLKENVQLKKIFQN